MSVLKKAFSSLKDGFEPGEFAAGGAIIVCPHCKNEVFNLTTAQLNTSLASFFNLDWDNRSAYILICTHCSMILWFKDLPSRV